jgi:hypothetical protein
MSVFNIACWALAGVLAGSIAAAIGGRRETVLALAGVIAAYLCLLHLYLYWPNFPWWYNLGVALPAAPAVLLGGTLRRALARPRTTPVVQ